MHISKTDLDLFFFADSFPIFFSLLLLSFFSLFLFSLSSTLYPLSIHGKVLASALQKTCKWNIDQHCDLAYFTINFAPKIGHVFSGIALYKFCTQNWTRFLEFGQYSKWTHVWMDLSLLR